MVDYKEVISFFYLIILITKNDGKDNLEILYKKTNHKRQMVWNKEIPIDHQIYKLRMTKKLHWMDKWIPSRPFFLPKIDILLYLGLCVCKLGLMHEYYSNKK